MIAVKAVTGANAVYTDVWASMGQEAKPQRGCSIFAPYQVNRKLFYLAAPSMPVHALPACASR